MDDNNNRKLNNDNEVSPEQQDIYDEIIGGADEMAQSFFDGELTREELLRREAEQKEKRELEAIKADIEKRYTQEVEETMRNVESISSPAAPKSETAKLDEMINLDSFSNPAPSKKKKTRKAKRRKRAQYIELEEKNSLYRFVYLLGDFVSYFFSLAFGNLFGIIAVPFVKLFNAVRDAIISRRMSTALNDGVIEAR
ncbi:MAG: hypothetical protein IKI78_06670, partial [Clostridia bacterium]|nr:hypothetical protein [Clostridia bacterium]